MSRPFELQAMLRSWTPPKGLRQSRWREVQLSAGGRALAVLAILLLAGSAASLAGLTAIVQKETREVERLRTEGVETGAQIVRLTRSRDKKTRFRLVYRFQAGVSEFERQMNVTAATARSLAVGSSVAIRYVPSDPEINYPAGWKRKTMPVWLPPLVAIGLLALSWLPAHALRHQRRLLVEGRPAPAVVTRHHKDQHGITVHYEFPLLSGAKATGKSGPVKKPPAIGSEICILYDPDQPSTNSRYPLSLVKPRPL